MGLFAEQAFIFDRGVSAGERAPRVCWHPKGAWSECREMIQLAYNLDRDPITTGPGPAEWLRKVFRAASRRSIQTA